MVSEMGTVLLIIPPPLSVSHSAGFCVRGGPNRGKWTRALNEKSTGLSETATDKEAGTLFYYGLY